MAQFSSQALTSLILQMAAATKDGAALKDILVLPALSLQRRKVQRRLQALVKEGRLRQEGSTRAARYWLVASPAEPQVAASLESKVKTDYRRDSA